MRKERPFWAFELKISTLTITDTSFLPHQTKCINRKIFSRNPFGGYSKAYPSSSWAFTLDYYTAARRRPLTKACIINSQGRQAVLDSAVQNLNGGSFIWKTQTGRTDGRFPASLVAMTIRGERMPRMRAAGRREKILFPSCSRNVCQTICTLWISLDAIQRAPKSESVSVKEKANKWFVMPLRSTLSGHMTNATPPKPCLADYDPI